MSGALLLFGSVQRPSRRERRHRAPELRRKAIERGLEACARSDHPGNNHILDRAVDTGLLAVKKQMRHAIDHVHANARKEYRGIHGRLAHESVAWDIFGDFEKG